MELVHETTKLVLAGVTETEVATAGRVGPEAVEETTDDPATLVA